MSDNNLEKRKKNSSINLVQHSCCSYSSSYNTNTSLNLEKKKKKQKTHLDIDSLGAVHQ